MTDLEKLRALSRALLASLRWSYDDTADFVRGKSLDDPTYDPHFKADVKEMRVGLAIAEEVLR
ncbi:MAG: hypothetical protein BWY96_03177 [Spirochaetes bacterium ADurb.BinA120]|nr:MAG: hypothetical protein BWY96_03177 [Spirochaetes bacterium ADurb.BinA120]